MFDELTPAEVNPKGQQNSFGKDAAETQPKPLEGAANAHEAVRVFPTWLQDLHKKQNAAVAAASGSAAEIPEKEFRGDPLEEHNLG